jgi:hypothetical protein
MTDTTPPAQPATPAVRSVSLVSTSRAADAGFLTLVDVRVQLTSRKGLAMRLALPDLPAALCLKALAYRGRFAAKDAVDLWRLLTAAHAAGLRKEDWPGGTTGRKAAEVLHRFFGAPSGTGLKQMSSVRADRTRMQALVRQVVPRY